jgi:hypothetical protein
MSEVEQSKIIIPIKWKRAFSIHDWNEILIWCLDNIGLPGNGYECKMEEEAIYIVFDRKEDATLFLLTWGIDDI